MTLQRPHLQISPEEPKKELEGLEEDFCCWERKLLKELVFQLL